jgi:hypothetical protein
VAHRGSWVNPPGADEAACLRLACASVVVVDGHLPRRPQAARHYVDGKDRLHLRPWVASRSAFGVTGLYHAEEALQCIDCDCMDPEEKVARGCSRDSGWSVTAQPGMPDPGRDPENVMVGVQYCIYRLDTRSASLVARNYAVLELLEQNECARARFDAAVAVHESSVRPETWYGDVPIPERAGVLSRLLELRMA